MEATLLTVAGLDPSGGAGVLLDAVVFRSLGFRAAAVVTALTVQDTAAVRAVRPVPAAFLRRQWEALRRDLPLAGIKVGMAGSAASWEAIGRGLSRHPGLPRVVDPVLRASSGASLAGRSPARDIAAALAGRVTLLTPNLDEAAFLAGRPVDGEMAMAEAARRIQADLGGACLVKGGHLRGAPLDILFDGRRIHRFAHPRLGREAHGTGCFLSSAILARLAAGDDLVEACREGIRLVTAAIRRSVRPGRGRFLLAP